MKKKKICDCKPLREIFRESFVFFLVDAVESKSVKTIPLKWWREKWPKKKNKKTSFVINRFLNTFLQYPSILQSFCIQQNAVLISITLLHKDSFGCVCVKYLDIFGKISILHPHKDDSHVWILKNEFEMKIKLINVIWSMKNTLIHLGTEKNDRNNHQKNWFLKDSLFWANHKYFVLSFQLRFFHQHTERQSLKAPKASSLKIFLQGKQARRISS